MMVMMMMVMMVMMGGVQPILTDVAIHRHRLAEHLVEAVKHDLLKLRMKSKIAGKRKRDMRVLSLVLRHLLLKPLNQDAGNKNTEEQRSA